MALTSQFDQFHQRLLVQRLLLEPAVTAIAKQQITKHVASSVSGRVLMRPFFLERREARAAGPLVRSGQHYWSNRIYEILGRGGFLLHPRTVGLDAEFRDGEHYAGYDCGDWTWLRERIDYWLTHADEREHIRRTGFERMATLTYRDRCAELLQKIC